MDAIHDDSIAIHSLSICQLLNGQLAELAAILDSLFTDIANTISTPIRVEGGGWNVVGSYKVRSRQRLHQHSKWPNGIYWCHFMCIHIPHKSAKSNAKLIYQLCGKLRLALCFSSHLKTTEHS